MIKLEIKLVNFTQLLLKRSKYLILCVCFFSFNSVAQVEVKYFNERFTWVKVPSKFVKAGLNYPKDGMSICWIKVAANNERFDFVFRRALEYDECLKYVSDIRVLLSTNQEVEVIGNRGDKYKTGEYYSLWELIRAKSGCVGYFGGCENFEKKNPDWMDWRMKPLSKTLYP